MKARCLALACLVLPAVLAAASPSVTKRRDGLGRVVFRGAEAQPTSWDDDLAPLSTEELLEQLRRMPAIPGRVSQDIPFAELIREGSLRYGVDAGLVEAVMATESAFNPFAVSHAGAIGLMQLMPDTARRFEVDDIFDPRQNVLAGCRYLSFLLARFEGDIDLALAGYNAGENAVTRHGGVPPYRETRNYVRKVRRYLRQLEREEGSRRGPGPGGSPSLRRNREDPQRLLKPTPPAAPIYHYVDERGVVHFTNVEPEAQGKKVHVWRPGR